MKFRNASDKESWEKLLIMDMMSSEESVSDEGKEVLKIRKPSWRKPVVEEQMPTNGQCTHNSSERH